MSAPALARERALLAPSSELSWLALTADQAHILNQIVHRHRAGITERWSHGIWDGLSQSLYDIERAGGAYIRGLPGVTREGLAFGPLPRPTSTASCSPDHPEPPAI